MSAQKILIYILRRDLRVVDNPILNELSNLWSKSHAPFTAVLPIYVFPAQQVEVSGFVKQGEKSPYPEARSSVGKYWRCGTHRAKFLAESAWELKKDLERQGSGLEIRVGLLVDVVKSVLDGYKDDEITGLWMTDEEGVEEKREVKAVRDEVRKRSKEFKLWKDEKYFIDDDDLPYKSADELPDVFSTFRKHVEPLRDAPRRALPRPSKLPPLPSDIPPQASPFEIPSSLDGIIAALKKPLEEKPDIKNPPEQPSDNQAKTAIPFTGGASTAQSRLKHLLKSGSMSGYKDTRNGLLGPDFSSKFSAWLALGCITARQIHAELLVFEDGGNDDYKGSTGYGKGENKGTAAMRFELLWRDYFRLCTRKFGPRLFREGGFRNANDIKWKYDKEKLTRWLEGTTGMGLVDAAQRELWLTGYTSNRTRQNVASYLSKHLMLDWRLGAEWYETHLVDYDLSSNWGNWQYNSGVGNDPRDGGMGRKFNPVKQGHDYDPKAEYVRTWVPEVKDVETPSEAFQYEPKEGEPLVRIEFRARNGGGQQPKKSGGGRFKGDRPGHGKRGKKQFKDNPATD